MATRSDRADLNLADTQLEQSAVLDKLKAIQLETAHVALQSAQFAHLPAEIEQKLASAQKNMACLDQVAKLLLIKSRIDQCIELSRQIQTLADCIRELHNSMESQNWDLAAKQFAKSLEIPAEIIDSQLAETVVPYSLEPDPPRIILTSYADILSTLFEKKFVQAALDRNQNQITDYFIKFVEIGRSNRGIELYLEYVTGLLIQPNSSTHSFEQMSNLLEQVVKIITAHGPFIQKYCGSSNLIKVIEYLQQHEVEDRLESIINDMWSRLEIQKTLYEIQIWDFKVLFDKLNMQNSSPTLQKDSEVQTKDPVAVSIVLTQLCNVLSNWNLYVYVVTFKLMQPCFKEEEQVSKSEIFTKSRVEVELIPKISNVYCEMEIWYFRRSLEIAIEQSQDDLKNQHPFSSYIDDTVFILKLCLERITSTGIVSIVDRVVTGLSLILEKNYYGFLRIELQQVKSVLKTCIFLNNCCFANRNSKQIISEILLNKELESVFCFDSDFSKVKQKLRSLSKFQSYVATLRQSAIEQVFLTDVRPKIVTIITASFDIKKDFNLHHHSISQSFNKIWDTSLEGYQEHLDPEPLESLYEVMIQAVVQPLLERIFDFKCTDTEAIYLDKEISKIISHVNQTYKTRKYFEKIKEVMTIICSEYFQDLDQVLINETEKFTTFCSTIRQSLSLKILDDKEISRALQMKL